MALRSYSGTAKTTSLSGAITAAATTINVVDATGYPSGGEPFVITIDAGLTTEEKVLCSGRTSNSLAVASAGRGWDGTTASDHDNSAPVAHTFSATDAREANAHVNDTSGDPHPQYLTAADGAVLYASGAHTHPAVPDPTKTVRIPVELSAEGTLAVGTTRGSFIPAPPSQTVLLTKARLQMRSGGPTVTVKFQKNGADISGWTGVSVSTTATTIDPADVPLADGDRLDLVITAGEGSGGTPTGLLCTAWLDVTV